MEQTLPAFEFADSHFTGRLFLGNKPVTVTRRGKHDIKVESGSMSFMSHPGMYLTLEVR
jgi:hypothetical protein